MMNNQPREREHIERDVKKERGEKKIGRDIKRGRR